MAAEAPSKSKGTLTRRQGDGWSPSRGFHSPLARCFPCSFSSVTVLPNLDAVEDVTCKSFENVSDADKKRMVSDVESDDDGDHHHAVKRLKEAPVDQSSCETENVSAMKGQLMIGGVWMKVTDEEVAAIESDVRIFG